MIEDFDYWIKLHQERIENFMMKFIKKEESNSITHEVCRYGSLNGGKRFRALLSYAIGEINQTNKLILDHIAAAIEFIHAYSLIHDDLPSMDNDNLRRGRLSTHKKFGESTAILAGNSLLTLALEILTDNNLKINNKSKVYLASFISKSSGHEGIAGGQYYDLNFEKKKISLTKILNMQTNKTGKLFGFCCVAPLLILSKKKELSKFNKIGEDIGLLFQITDDLIDFRGDKKIAGKKTRKDLTKGKATLITLLGYKNTIEYAEKLKLNIIKKIKIYGNKSSDLKDTIEFILNRNR